MSNVLLVSPSKFTQNFFEKNHNYFYLDNNGFWKYDVELNKRINIPLSEIRINWANVIDPHEIYKKLDWYSPTWQRWAANGEQYELLKREALWRVFRLQEGVKLFEIKYCLIFTGIPHHIDSLINETAFSSIGLKQYHLYSNVIDLRLMPLMHNSSVSDRTLIKSYISDYNINSSLNKFIENKKLGNPPPDSEIATDWRVLYSLSIAFLIYLTLKKRLRLLLSKTIRNKWFEESLLESLYGLGFFSQLRMYKNQKKALKFYESNIISNKEYKEYVGNKDKPSILIAAHFQPEATTFPEGGEFGNHIDIVIKIRRGGFKGEILYKEHKGSYMYCSGIIGTTQVGMSRSLSYYKQLQDLGCKFISPDILLDVKKETSEYYLPLTITGSIAIERSLFGLQTIVAGNPWWLGLPGTILLESIDFKLDVDYKVCRYSEKIEEASYEFFVDQLNNSTLTNAQGIGTGIIVQSDMTIFCEEIQILINNIEKKI